MHVHKPRPVQFGTKLESLSRRKKDGKTVVRGRSAVAAAAYRTRSRMIDLNQGGLVFDYRYRETERHTWSSLLIPPGCADAELLEEDYWNLVERAENRSDAVTAHNIRVDLPRFLSDEQYEVLSEKLGRLVQSYYAASGAEIVVGASLHIAKAAVGGDHPHCDLQFSERGVSAAGSEFILSRTKTRLLSDSQGPRLRTQ